MTYCGIPSVAAFASAALLCYNSLGKIVTKKDLTDEQLHPRGQTALRGERKFADYVLYHQNIPLAIVEAKENPQAEVDIAMVGKYVDLRDSYISLSEALLHGGIHTSTRVNIHYFESQDIEREGVDCLRDMDGIVVPGGFGDRGV